MNPDRFVEDVGEHLLCSVCFDVFKNPVICCKNGHTHCRDCLDDCIAADVGCPDCAQTISADRIIRNLRLNDEIDGMHVRCRHVDGSIAEPTASTQPVKKKKSRSSGGSGRSTKRRKKENGGPAGATGHASQAAAEGTGSSLSSLSEARPPGCTWVGMLRDEVTHQRECPCELLLCQCGCGREYERQEFNEKDGSCPDQADSCEFCGETMRARELKPHLRVCTKVESCPRGCGERFEPTSLLKHAGVCPKAEVLCPFHQFGCRSVVTRETAEEHGATQGERHALLLAVVVSGQLTEKNAVLRSLRHRIEGLCKETTKMIDVYSMDRKVEELMAEGGTADDKQVAEVLHGHPAELGTGFADQVARVKELSKQEKIWANPADHSEIFAHLKAGFPTSDSVCVWEIQNIWGKLASVKATETPQVSQMFNLGFIPGKGEYWGMLTLRLSHNREFLLVGIQHASNGASMPMSIEGTVTVICGDGTELGRVIVQPGSQIKTHGGVFTQAMPTEFTKLFKSVTELKQTSLFVVGRLSLLHPPTPTSKLLTTVKLLTA